MKFLKSIITFCVLAYGLSLTAHSSTSIMPKKDRDTISVLLLKDASEALLEVRGPYYIFNPSDRSKISSGLLGKRFLVHSIRDGLKWGQEFLGYHQIYLVPRSEKSSILVNGTQYEGAIAVYKIGDKIQVINDLNIDSYLKATLTPQFPYPVEQEVLSAISIAARTTAYYHRIKDKQAFWHVDANDVDYKGSSILLPNAPIAKAIDATNHLILVHSHDGKNAPFVATWTEHSAGKTAAFPKIFRQSLSSRLEGVEAPHAKLDRNDAKWSYTITKNDIASLFNMKRLDALDTFVDQESNKIYALRLTEGKQTYDIDFLSFQRELGINNLQSNDFTLQTKFDKIAFSGFGKGHGVGLCLHSASAMALQGKMAIEMLSTFYPKTFLVNLSALPKTEKK